jgi:glucose/arabinose dehydrogenase
MTDAPHPFPAPATGRRIGLLAATLMLAATACGTGADDVPDAPPPVVDADPEREPEPPASPSGGDEPTATDDAGDAVAAEPEPPTEPDLSVALTLSEVATLDGPIAGAVGPDGTLYLADRAGTVHPLTADGVGEPVVDMSDETTTESERGLLGIAFAADGGELYLSHTDRDGASTLTAVAVMDGEVQANERRTVFRVSQPYANHNGGDVHIGPDGLLYLGLGDGGGAGDPLGAGQDLSTPLGALLRIDPQRGEPYAVPDGNPFVDVEGAAPEIFAYGLRNPWRFSFDPVTDALWIGDVGQDAREEINRVDLEEAAGANFGWNLMEGTTSFAGSPPGDHVPPVYEYETRGPQGCAVTGGVVYRGSEIPELTGVYLYADACNGSVRGLLVDADGQVLEQADLGVDGGQVVAFVPDADGEVYVLDLGGGVRRLEPA